VCAIQSATNLHALSRQTFEGFLFRLGASGEISQSARFSWRSSGGGGSLPDGEAPRRRFRRSKRERSEGNHMTSSGNSRTASVAALLAVLAFSAAFLSTHGGRDAGDGGMRDNALGLRVPAGIGEIRIGRTPQIVPLPACTPPAAGVTYTREYECESTPLKNCVADPILGCDPQPPDCAGACTRRYVYIPNPGNPAPGSLSPVTNCGQLMSQRKLGQCMSVVNPGVHCNCKLAQNLVLCDAVPTSFNLPFALCSNPGGG